MNTSEYCTTHKRKCFAGSSSSTSCRPGQTTTEFDFDTETDSDHSNDDTPDGYIEEEQQTQLKNKVAKTLAHKQDQQPRPDMMIADLYIPSHIHNHRIVRGGRTPAQIQFLVEWKNGWTADRLLAQNILRKHASSDLWFVNYKSSWEPYSEYYDTITPDMINTYRRENGIEQFGSGFDKQIEALSKKDRKSLATDSCPFHR
jgi:hypothetical protein